MGWRHGESVPREHDDNNILGYCMDLNLRIAHVKVKLRTKPSETMQIAACCTIAFVHIFRHEWFIPSTTDTVPRFDQGPMLVITIVHRLGPSRRTMHESRNCAHLTEGHPNKVSIAQSNAKCASGRSLVFVCLPTFGSTAVAMQPLSHFAKGVL